eukprot:CAMPEP_0119302742 /NCGR_PEP_ID=MMETSP1333-20130426/4291_1 /TAXON_ID=418940 /ORGANISM="Scyphosphaera apsteinii, Strain RCC1455" /LENGTH=436 /DNA_ID=CAMNT_0007305201 /DNA_START=62 /DNA_END=1372 /DNA_ORIENTATION=-
MPLSLLCNGKPQSGRQHFGFFTVPQGEEWSMLQPKGTVRHISGPSTTFTWGDELQKRSCVVASENEYILVKKLDGSGEVMGGPAAIWRDPLIHTALTLHASISLSAAEVVVVYREVESCKLEAKQVRREIVRGPCLYKPTVASEWRHSFSWHGHDPSGGELARKRPHGLKFEKLLISPSSTYFDVENVRTSDDALLTVRLMIFYRLQSIEKMLDSTNDPIADIVNSVSSDVISFCSARSFEIFKESSEQLNMLGVYQQLIDRSSQIGFCISQVVFRGYMAPTRLQKMHDDAIERRTKLVLERESESQEQLLKDERLAKEAERAQKVRAMERSQAEHQAAMKRATFEAQQREILDVAEQEAEIEKKRRSAEVAHQAELRTTLGLDSAAIANLMIAQVQGTPAKLIQVSGDCKSIIQLTESTDGAADAVSKTSSRKGK